MRLINSDSEAVEIGDGSTVNDNRFTVNLGGNTLLVMLLLALIIGANCYVMGLNMAKQDQLGAYTRDLATQYQINANHWRDVEAQLKEIEHHERR